MTEIAFPHSRNSQASQRDREVNKLVSRVSQTVTTASWNLRQIFSFSGPLFHQMLGDSALMWKSGKTEIPY